MKGWTLIHSGTDRAYAEILNALLQSENVTSVLIDKKDSSYPMLGQTEIWVQQNQAALAEQIINKSVHE